MKRYTTHAAWLFIASLVFIACSKNGSRQPELTGTWNWTLTNGGIAPMQSTPASTGIRKSLIINSDKTFKVYINDTIRLTGTYTTETGRCIHDHTNKQFYNFSNYMFACTIEKLTADSLIFAEEAYDGLGYYYTRVSGN